MTRLTAIGIEAERATMSERRVMVFGPAYLDRVLRVDRALTGLAAGPPIDQSVDGTGKFGGGPGLLLVDPSGAVIAIDPPPGWPGPLGEIRLDRPIPAGVPGRRDVRGTSWQDELGGMGAGYAAALRGRLCSALGPSCDATSRAVAAKLNHHGVAHVSIRIDGHPADWTLLVTSGAFGDKLAIGFRGCHAAIDPGQIARVAARPCDLRVAASLTNRLIEPVLRAPGAVTRFFAPALRNMVDRQVPVGRFADCIDILSCNRLEWESLGDRDEVARAVPILAVTDGARGITIRYRSGHDQPGEFHIPAFPRARTPRDTNRAGEAFGATLVATLLDSGWSGQARTVDEGHIRSAALRASAAAALVLDRLDFGFATPAEIDDTVRSGCVN